MNAPHRLSPTRWRALCGLPAAGLGLAGSLCAQVVIPEWALPAPYGDERPDIVVFAVGGASVDGDTARFQERTGLTDELFGGISQLSIFRELGEDADRVLKVRFKGLAGLNEGELDLSYEKLESWRFDLFVDQHRRYFDPQGGEAAASLEDLDLTPDALEMDFGTIRFQVEKSFEDLPTLRLRYTRRYRDGERDSTVWGQVGGRRIGASTREVQETSDTIALEAEKKGETRHWRVTGTYRRTEAEETLHATNDSLINSAEPITQNEKTTSDSVSLNGFVSQQLFEGATLSLGALVTQLDANVSGSRLVNNGSAFINLDGSSQLHQIVVNGNLAYRWNDYLDSVLALSIRGEDLESETSKNRGNPGDLANTTDDRDYTDIAFETRIRSSKKASFYVLYKYTGGDGVLSEDGNYISRRTESDLVAHRLGVGFRFYPVSYLSLTGEWSDNRRDNTYVHERFDTIPWRYPAQLDELEEASKDFNLRLTFRASPRLQLVSRFDYRDQTLRPSFVSGTGAGESEIEHYTFSQNIAVTPIPAVHLNLMLSWTENTHRTPLSITDSALSRILPESMNDHWSAQFGAYASLNEKTDLQIYGTYLRANNYENNSDVAFPFGAAEEEYRLEALLSRQITDNLRALVRYGYYKGKDLARENLNGYEAHVLYSSLQYRF